MSNPGILLCTRVHSRRLPRKALLPLQGKPLIRWQVERLLTKGYPICVAMPQEHDCDEIAEVLKGLPVTFFRGHRDDVLARFFWAAQDNKFDPVIRVTGDDIYTDMDMMVEMIDQHITGGYDYTSVSSCMRGADCEIISMSLLGKCYVKYIDRKSDYLSYMFRDPEFQPKILKYEPIGWKQTPARLEIDWPEDYMLSEVIFNHFKGAPSNADLLSFLRESPSLLNINKLPRVSVYTCAYNAADTIRDTIESILSQDCVDFEYILVDDGSTDDTSKIMMEYGDRPNVKLLRLPANVGLSSASNMALRDAKAKYIMRVDADDTLLPSALSIMANALAGHPDVSVIYPAYIKVVSKDRKGFIEKNTEHHLGGALIRNWVYQEIKFCDGMRHLDGQYFYDQLIKRGHNIKEIDIATWVYMTREGSLTTHMDEDKELAMRVLSHLKIVGNRLLIKRGEKGKEDAIK